MWWTPKSVDLDVVQLSRQDGCCLANRRREPVENEGGQGDFKGPRAPSLPELYMTVKAVEQKRGQIRQDGTRAWLHSHPSGRTASSDVVPPQADSANNKTKVNTVNKYIGRFFFAFLMILNLLFR